MLLYYTDMIRYIAFSSLGQLPEEVLKPVSPAHHLPPAVGTGLGAWEPGPTPATHEVSLLALMDFGVDLEFVQTNLHKKVSDWYY